MLDGIIRGSLLLYSQINRGCAVLKSCLPECLRFLLLSECLSLCYLRHSVERPTPSFLFIGTERGNFRDYTLSNIFRFRSVESEQFWSSIFVQAKYKGLSKMLSL